MKPVVPSKGTRQILLANWGPFTYHAIKKWPILRPIQPVIAFRQILKIIFL